MPPKGSKVQKSIKAENFPIFQDSAGSLSPTPMPEDSSSRGLTPHNENVANSRRSKQKTPSEDKGTNLKKTKICEPR